MDDRGPRTLEAAAAAQSITAAELREFLRLCAQRYEAKRMDPGAALRVPNAHCKPHASACLSAAQLDCNKAAG